MQQHIIKIHDYLICNVNLAQKLLLKQERTMLQNVWNWSDRFKNYAAVGGLKITASKI